MHDMEKVIKGVHDARKYLEDREWVDKSVGVHIDALNDALALLKDCGTQLQYRDDHIAMYQAEFKRLETLLKEQEAVRPVLDEQTGRVWLCGNCGTYVGFEDHDENDPNEFDKYCRECGRPVLWQGR